MIWGRTYTEKLNKLKNIQLKSKPWFAWRPVRLNDGRTVWLETVLRRRNSITAGWLFKVNDNDTR